MAESIKDILMSRDEMTSKEAQDLIDSTKLAIEDALHDGCDHEEIEEIVSSYLGLEPDYIFELI